MTRLCVVSAKQCWEDTPGRWVTTGGFPWQIAALASLFDETTIVIVGGERREGGMPLPAGATVVPLRRPAGGGLRRKLSVVAGLGHYLTHIVREVRRSDVVYVPLPGDISLLGFAAAVLLRRRLIARYGSSWAPTAQTTLMNRVTRMCMRLGAGPSAVMIATGDGDEPPAAGIQWLFATALSRRELEASEPAFDRGLSQPPTIAFLGRLSPEKGASVLLHALGLLRERSVPLPRTLLMGDGPERAKLERLADELGCRDAVVFTGMLDRVELVRRLRDVDLCVQPSLTESQAKAWLDAMAHGLPVLASEVGAGGRVMGQSGERGWLVPPGDAGALAARLEEILVTPRDWPALRRRCRAYAESRTLEAWIARIGEMCAARWRVRYAEGRLLL